MKLRDTLILSSVLIVAGASASYWYLNKADKPKGDGDDKTFKVGFLPVT